MAMERFHWLIQMAIYQLWVHKVAWVKDHEIKLDNSLDDSTRRQYLLKGSI